MKKTITTKNTWGEERKYEVVEKISVNFFIWNIGENMGTHEYIPVCERLYPGLKKTDNRYYHINPDTVKAVPVSPEEWKKLNRAVTWGIISKEEAEKALKSKRSGRMADRKRKLAAETIEIFKKITA